MKKYIDELLDAAKTKIRVELDLYFPVNIRVDENKRILRFNQAKNNTNT